MSYRTVKRLLGETSLERKCRFLFGGGLLLLITGSFYLYAWLNGNLVDDQNRLSARMLVAPYLLEKHWKSSEEDRPPEEQKTLLPLIENVGWDMKEDAIPDVDLADVKFAAFSAEKRAEGNETPGDPDDFDAIDKLLAADPTGDEPAEIVHVDEATKEYVYYKRIDARKSCLRCHHHREHATVEGETLGVVKVVLPLKGTKDALAWNNAILIATAIITAFLAMVAAYAIVRYVIVKPVLHLKDVSDEIARGNLDLRADIHTGDEFEELSHAFNRMLRHLVTVQDELRAVNTDLDGKVDELAEVNLTLYEMNRLKDDFLATMSHELRTPLNSILGFSDVLLELGSLDDRQERYVGNIRTSGKHLMALINDLLDLAKIESGKMELRVAEFPVGELVERQVSLVAPLAEKKNIDLACELDERVVHVTQDQRKLEQILNNLLSNAIKFTPEGGRVRVRTRLFDARQLELQVEDTGIGISLEDQARIFEKFRQGRTVPGRADAPGQDATTREYGGTGLGLSIVKELAKLLGGEVLLKSEFGRGSTFTVRIPIQLEAPRARLGETFGDLAETSLTPTSLRKSWSSETSDESAA